MALRREGNNDRYARHMTALVARPIAQAVEPGEWKISAEDAAAVRDAVTNYLYPTFVALLIEAGAPN
jgi:hypothetical protein